MPSQIFNFELTQDSKKRLSRFLDNLVNLRIREKFPELTSEIVKSVDKVVEQKKARFIPSFDDAVELGVGSKGQVYSAKIDNAWRALLPSREVATTITLSKAGRKGSSLIGEVRITIDRDAFFDADDSIIETPDSDEIAEIPWMRWFIDGKVITGVRFSNKSDIIPIPNSRTGYGIMINGGLWSFTPRVPLALDFMIEDMKITAQKAVTKTGAQIFRKNIDTGGKAGLI